jgi:hypothetical protein
MTIENIKAALRTYGGENRNDYRHQAADALEAQQKRIAELETLLRDILNAEGDCELMDAIDNTGTPYQSHYLDTALTKARAALQAGEAE